MAARVRAEDVAPGEVGPELIEVVRDLAKCRRKISSKITFAAASMRMSARDAEPGSIRRDLPVCVRQTSNRLLPPSKKGSMKHSEHPMRRSLTAPSHHNAHHDSFIIEHEKEVLPLNISSTLVELI